MMNKFDPFAQGAIERSVDSTEAQREIWLAIKMGGEQASLAYNESLTLELKGLVNPGLLRAGAEHLLARHDALRATFSGNGQSMLINTQTHLDFQTHDLRRLAQDDRQQRQSSTRTLEVRQPFDLLSGPLIRFQLLTIEDDRYDLILTAHHIVCDGWSLGVLVKELDEYCRTKPDSISNLSPASSFVDFAKSSREALYGTKGDATERYWCKQLDRPIELDMPTDHSRYEAMVDIDGVPTRNLSASQLDHNLNASLTKQINAAANVSKAGMFALMLATFAILLRRISAQEDFIIGVPVAAQALTDQADLVGHCVQLLPVRIQCTGEMTVASLAKSIKTTLLDGMENQGLTFGALLQRLSLPRDASRVPLIPVMFNLDQAFSITHIGEYAVEIISNPRVAENFDIFLNIVPQHKQFKLEAIFRTGLFDQNTIYNWLECYETSLGHSVTNLNCPVNDVPHLSNRQRHRQLYEWNHSSYTKEPVASTVLCRILETAGAHPSRIAIEDKQGSYSYEELVSRANEVASELISAGVTVGCYVGICRDPGIDLIAGLLGIWKVHCAYIPLDPGYPDERLRFIVQDTGVKLILGDGESPPEFASACQWLTTAKTENHNNNRLKVTVAGEPGPGNIAYIIHTSGSTGQAKGVVIAHSALDNLISAMGNKLEMDASVIMLAATPLSFDISILEIFAPLSFGGKVIIASREETRDSFALAKKLLECRANHMQATPSSWRAILDTGWPGNQQLTALCGGEALPLSLAKSLVSRVGKLWNLYGPTEATVWATAQRIADNPTKIPLGRAIDNCFALVLDKHFNLLPPGATGGELFLGGAGLAEAYLGRPQLSSESFIDNPFLEMPGDRIYRTGDMAKLDADGHIYYLGRTDNQIKVRGYRIEAGEIEHVLTGIEAVSEALVVAQSIDDGDTRLIAYVTTRDQNNIDLRHLYAQLKQTLPPQCIPNHIAIVASLHHTDNGKIDRNVLPEPVESADEQTVELRSDTQRKIAEIWRELLRVHEIAAQDDFFLLGGHSMIAVRMLARIRDVYALELPLQSIYHDRNITNLATRIDLLLMQKGVLENPIQADTVMIEI